MGMSSATIAESKVTINDNCFTRFVVYPIGNGRYMVQSVPGELSLQETSVLTTAANQGQGYVTIDMLMEKLG